MKSLKTFIYEASLAGSTTNYQRPTGAFYKYVQNAKDPNMDFEADRDAKLYDLGQNVVGEISQGEKFKIVDRDEKDLNMMGRSYVTKIKYQGKEYFMRLSDILKPSGKKVDYIQVDLKDKINPNVWEPFKGGHGHEGQIANVFINGSGGNWEFEHKGKEYHIKRIGEPHYKGVGNPKTDLYVELVEKLPGYGNQLKYSLKAANATFIENWMKPERFEQIFGKAKSIRTIMQMYEDLNKDSKAVVGNSKAPTLHWFIVDTSITKKHTGIILDKKESLEAFSGENKFGKGHEATANCWLKGDPTETITALLDRTKPIKSHGVKAALFIRGYGKASKSACFLKDNQGWKVNSHWIKYFKLPKHFAKAPK